ncbi:Unannotated [Lentimonas sp. CC19]|nr:Unannotated [Lentimonas sp. CC19]CAA6692224.1 Unannotated [Lentimonas sp. CC10]CAA7070166.1 Unannotated [Lentimonas sp. CC11]
MGKEIEELIDDPEGSFEHHSTTEPGTSIAGIITDPPSPMHHELTYTGMTYTRDDQSTCTDQTGSSYARQGGRVVGLTNVISHKGAKAQS